MNNCRKTVKWILLLLAVSGAVAKVMAQEADFLSYPWSKQKALLKNNNNTRVLSSNSGSELQIIGSWPFGEVYAVTSDSTRNLLFLGSGGGVYIADASDPYNLTPVSNAIRTQGLVLGCFYTDGRLYIATGYPGIEIWDVTNPSFPLKLGAFDTEGYATKVYVSGRYAYVADTEAGMRIIDVFDPSNPHEVGFYETEGHVINVNISETYAYLACDYIGMYILDISNPKRPKVVGAYDTWGSARDIEILGSYAYIADWGMGIAVVDISNLSNPKLVYNYWASSNFTLDISIAGSYMYVAEEQLYLGPGRVFEVNVEIINISDPLHLQHVINLIGYHRRGKSQMVCVFNKHVYLAAAWGGLYVWNVSTPTNPQPAFRYITPITAKDVHISNNFAYVVDYWAGLHIIDISNLSSSFEAAAYIREGFSNIYISGDFAYITARGQLNIFDISNPLPPVKVGEISFSDYHDPTSIYVSGSYAYLSMKGGWFIIDISDPANPSEVARVDGSALDICVSGSYAYVIPGLKIFDISNPSNPILLSEAQGLTGSPQGIYISGHYAYVAYEIVLGPYSGGLGGIVDVTDPLNPTVLANYITPGESKSVYVSGSYAYLANGWNGLVVIDVSDPSNPVEVEYDLTPGIAMDVFGTDGYIYLADGAAGLRIYQFSATEVEKKSKDIPCQSFALQQNFPNPFNTQTTIEYQLPRSSYVCLEIYDLLGRRVRTLVDGKKEAGVHRVEWDGKNMLGKNVASGVYICRMQAGGFVNRRKLVLIY
ncbi:T9SS type A sorting domain-containing protein [bacterium]|nr:T9SS type A sorting domain-containing protein [bacterium]